LNGAEESSRSNQRRYGRCAIGFGLFPPGVLAFKGHAAFHRVSEELGVLAAPRSS
jgi:hypothetical protein